MSVQPSITSYFGKRKRLVVDGGYKSKQLKTGHPSLVPSQSAKSVYEDEIDEVKRSANHTPRSSAPDGIRSAKEKCDHEASDSQDLEKCSEPPPPSPVKFQLMGSLSPIKKSCQKTKFNKDEYNVGVIECSGQQRTPTPSKNDSSVKNLKFSENKSECATEDIIKSAKELASKIKETREKLRIGSSRQKELSLKEIKDKINRSSKLTELKKSISKINQHAEELIELEKKKLAGTQPKLSQFKSFEISVPVSPVKQQKSPSKPAYERYAGLVDSPTTALPLPYGYQKLYEFFCAVDTICSMITNRGEMLTFNKLKPGVEEMTRKTFTTRHLGQIATVYPEAYGFHQEKLRNFGSTSKSDKYELVITARIPINPELKERGQKGGGENADENVFRSMERRAMTPAIMKKRKERFYNNLLEKTKDYHEEFLKTLNPPITINRNAIKRWHPSFMVDFVPDVTPEELPQPPNSEKAASAKQILDRAKEFLSSNARLQKALEAAAHEGETSGERASAVSKLSPEVKARVDARLKDPLKGISKSLLEKVRARQAAKALDAMQTTPAQEKEIITYMRLPDMARIVRTTFVNEQKGVLPLEVLLEKVQFSCNRNLGLKEVENHVRLLIQTLPHWLSIVTLRNVDFVKISRNADVASVMAELNRVVEEKKKKTGK